MVNSAEKATNKMLNVRQIQKKTKNPAQETSPTRTRAARRFFFGGSRVAPDDEEELEGTVAGGSPVDGPWGFSSTLAAGVKGGSAILFIGTTGVNAGEMEGSATDCTDGVEEGVAMVEERGSEWWYAIDCS